MALSLVLLLLTGALATPVSHFRRQLGQTRELYECGWSATPEANPHLATDEYPDPAVHGPEPRELLPLLLLDESS